MKIVSIRVLSNEKINSFISKCDELDKYFHLYALQNDIDNISKTFAYIDNDIVKGYITLCNSEVDFLDVPDEYKTQTPKYPFPAVKIARLAVAYEYRGKGIGKALLKEAIVKTIKVSISSGVMLLIVDAKKESTTFYEHYGFKKLVGYKYKYFISVQTLINALLKKNL